MERAKAEDDNKTQDDRPIGQLATLTPPEQSGEPSKPSATDIARLLMIELRRVGCISGAIDGNWSRAAARSLGLFNKNAGTKLDVKVASLDALDAVRSKPARICPLICEHGYKPNGDTCTKITCKASYQVGDDNTCERIEVEKPAKPVANRVEPAAGATPSVASGAGVPGCETDSRCSQKCRGAIPREYPTMKACMDDWGPRNLALRAAIRDARVRAEAERRTH
jgi:hypothetical protein